MLFRSRCLSAGTAGLPSYPARPSRAIARTRAFGAVRCRGVPRRIRRYFAAGRGRALGALPREYKRGKPKEHAADELQLCAQALCLEEMLCCSIPSGALFYGEPKRRTPVEFSPELRQTVREMAAEMHAYAARGYTPKAKPSKSCNAC